jgi:uncharacterized repeat protein (TIGR03803 family)
MPRKQFLLFLGAAWSMVLTVTVAPAWAASTYKVLHRFAGTDGRNPAASLVFDGAGNLYGTTGGGGGSQECGTVFKLAPAGNGKWTRSVLHYFGVGKYGCGPVAGVILDTAGNLYGTTSSAGASGGGTVFKLAADGNGQWTQTVLHSFSGADGAESHAGLIFDNAGNLYGTTEAGGAFGEGTVFQLTRGTNGQWTETLLYSFCSASNCSDGAQPLAGVVFDAAGNLYGTTSVGGDTRFCSGEGCGTVFQLTPGSNGKWTETVLHSFNLADGSDPRASLILDKSGNLYGTTIGIDAPPSCSEGCGTVFQLSPGAQGQWTENVLYSFCSVLKCKDGANPAANLAFDGAGNLIGTTTLGGYCCGTVFQLSPGANGLWTETTVHLFGTGAGGKIPHAGVIIDGSGNLYGATEEGGTSLCAGGCGVVFEITP